MDNIAQALEIFLRSLSTVLVSGAMTDFGTKAEQILSASNAMLAAVLPAFLQRLDDTLFEDVQRKAEWEVVRRDRRALLTVFGELRFERRYYRHRENGERVHLLDRYLGIQTKAKINGDVRQKAVTLAEQGSYSKSASASSVSPISRMSVCNYVGDLEQFPLLEAEGEKRSVKQLYVEADEDHVSLQNGKKTQVKLVYIHEGVKQQGKRRRLVNPRYLTWPAGNDNELLWETVSRYIDQQYVTEDIEHIFLSGDCASWIRKGEEWLYPCVPILDSFHTMKALRKLCSGRQEQVSAFLGYVGKDESDKAKDLCKSILNEVMESERVTKLKQANYLLNNWQRIRNQRYPGVQGCSAEGHVSHILSERLSSRPLGWSKKNMENIAQLRVMKANGQKIVYEDLRQAKSHPEMMRTSSKAVALVSTSRLRKALRKSVQSTLKTTCRNLPILNTGATTPLFQVLHALSFDYVAC